MGIPLNGRIKSKDKNGNDTTTEYNKKPQEVFDEIQDNIRRRNTASITKNTGEYTPPKSAVPNIVPSSKDFNGNTQGQSEAAAQNNSFPKEYAGMKIQSQTTTKDGKTIYTLIDKNNRTHIWERPAAQPAPTASQTKVPKLFQKQ
jgi:hypothetical protein